MGKYGQTVRPEDAARRLGMSVECLRECMKQNKFPIEIGVAIKKSGNKNFSYYILENRLTALEKLWGFYD